MANQIILLIHIYAVSKCLSNSYMYKRIRKTRINELFSIFYPINISIAFKKKKKLYGILLNNEDFFLHKTKLQYLCFHKIFTLKHCHIFLTLKKYTYILHLPVPVIVAFKKYLSAIAYRKTSSKFRFHYFSNFKYEFNTALYK